MSLEHIEVFLVIFSETSETGHVGPWVIWRGMTQLQKVIEDFLPHLIVFIDDHQVA